MKPCPANLTRREFVGSLGALSAARLKAEAQVVRRRPNVLVIIVDQWSGAAPDLAGRGQILQTPAARALGASGVRFENAYCTYPLCSPSRASLFTGRMPHETGVIFNVETGGNTVPESMPTMGSLFAEAGYATGYFGKEHIGGAGYRGFHARGSIQFPGAGYLASGSVLDAVFVRDAIEFIQSRRRRPFLAVVSLINPHDIGYTLPNAPIPNKSMVDICGAFDLQAGKYLRGQDFPPLPPNFDPPALPLMCHPLLRRLHSVQQSWTEREWRLYLATYYLLVENTDWLIGRLLQALEGAELEKDTLILFTADHGDQMTAHHLVGKGTFYEEAARVPFVVSWEGVINPGQVNDGNLVSGVDVLPTLCDYAGVEIPRGLAGQSLRPLLERGRAPWRSYLVSEIFDGRMVRTESHKYVLHQRDQSAEFLFDLRSDPGETRNLAEDRGSQATLEANRELLAAWMKETGGTFERTRPTEQMRRFLESVSPATDNRR